jgi:acyl carrier protein
MEPLEPGKPFVIRRGQLPLLTQAYRAPGTATEKRLAEIWSAALSVDQVGMDDRYGDLGGDSLIAAVIFSRIEGELGVHLPMVTLDSAPTIAALAAGIDALLPAIDAGRA